MQVEIVTPESVLYSGEADMVIARGLAGEVGVLKDHEPMLIEQGPNSLCKCALG